MEHRHHTRSEILSKLTEKIRSAARSEPQPLGFGSAKVAVVSTMVLAGIARDANGAGELVKRGADIVILGSSKSPASAGSGKELNGTIAGARIAGKTANEATSYREGGFDFVVFDPNSAAATALLEEKIGYVLALPDDLSDNEMRTLESFQLDAIDIGTVSGALTVRRQIDLRRIFALTRKPLMATVDANISVSELQALRDTNVLVAVVEGAENVERLRKTIDALPPRSRRKDDDRPTPLVPHNAMADDEESDEHDHE
jgi:hypothetical protein